MESLWVGQWEKSTSSAILVSVESIVEVLQNKLQDSKNLEADSSSEEDPGEQSGISTILVEKEGKGNVHGSLRDVAKQTSGKLSWYRWKYWLPASNSHETHHRMCKGGYEYASLLPHEEWSLQMP